MKVSPFRLHSEVFIFMIDCAVKWLVSQNIIKKKKNSQAKEKSTQYGRKYPLILPKVYEK